MSLDQLAQAREHLTDAQLVAFLHAAATMGDRPTSAQLFYRSVNAGRSLDALFTPMDEKKIPPRYRSEVSLSVTPLDVRTFSIGFGLKGRNFGDGGRWRVSFAEDGTLESMEQEDYWCIIPEAIRAKDE